MAGKLPVFRKGSTPTLLDSKTANDLRNRVQALCDLVVSPAGFGKMEAGPTQAILDLSPLQALVTQLQQQLDAIQQSNGGSGGGNTDSLAKKINGVIAAIQNCTLTATCDPITRAITVTITFPGLPSQS